jgi:hypothetical protein
VYRTEKPAESTDLKNEFVKLKADQDKFLLTNHTQGPNLLINNSVDKDEEFNRKMSVFVNNNMPNLVSAVKKRIQPEYTKSKVVRGLGKKTLEANRLKQVASDPVVLVNNQSEPTVLSNNTQEPEPEQVQELEPEPESEPEPELEPKVLFDQNDKIKQKKEKKTKKKEDIPPFSVSATSTPSTTPSKVMVTNKVVVELTPLQEYKKLFKELNEKPKDRYTLATDETLRKYIETLKKKKGKFTKPKSTNEV